ncbi:hypothetical protein SLI_3993 [Streptomyces lividans 1326]|uniref:Uncharacterized protein n=1 Tax=Streptomyces lividans 1326 TaxID=1200984 RepID=A0A7U9DST9_STRLI|nr:hypothetical protein SLI_3993 [Streptomyces lividans 1326]
MTHRDGAGGREYRGGTGGRRAPAPTPVPLPAIDDTGPDPPEPGAGLAS